MKHYMVILAAKSISGRCTPACHLQRSKTACTIAIALCGAAPAPLTCGAPCSDILTDDTKSELYANEESGKGWVCVCWAVAGWCQTMLKKLGMQQSLGPVR